MALSPTASTAGSVRSVQAPAPVVNLCSQSALDLERHYRHIQAQFDVRWAPKYARLVTADGNTRAPIHRWFRFKEAFSAELVPAILTAGDLPTGGALRVLDPFAGTGTTLASVGDVVASGGLRRATVYGVECNPFLHLVASTKVRAYQRPVPSFLRLARKVAAAAISRGKGDQERPTLSTFSNPLFFDDRAVDALLALRTALDAERALGADPDVLDLLRVCLGSIVEPVSNLRRDGRALRHVSKFEKPEAIQAFLSKAEDVDDDLRTSPTRLRGSVYLGDGRTLEGLDGRHAPFDLAIFSPPYPNNIDYTEVYKLENFILGYITTSDEFAAQRFRTVYSHPSRLRNPSLPHPELEQRENDLIRDAVAPLLAAVPSSDRYHLGRTRMFEGYAVDMYRTLRSIRSRLAPNGRIAYVVGNSVHGTVPFHFVVAADLLIASLAIAAGYTVDHIAIARYPRRRFVESEFLRESVVILRLSD